MTIASSAGAAAPCPDVRKEAADMPNEPETDRRVGPELAHLVLWWMLWRAWVRAGGRGPEAVWGAWCFSDWGSFSSRESIGWRPCQQRNTQTSSRPKWCVR